MEYDRNLNTFPSFKNKVHCQIQKSGLSASQWNTEIKYVNQFMNLKSKQKVMNPYESETYLKKSRGGIYHAWVNTLKGYVDMTNTMI